MKFLCLICAEKVMEQMPPAGAEKHFQEYVKFTEWIKATGQFIGANRLKPAAAATVASAPAAFRVRVWQLMSRGRTTHARMDFVDQVGEQIV